MQTSALDNRALYYTDHPIADKMSWEGIILHVNTLIWKHLGHSLNKLQQQQKNEMLNWHFSLSLANSMNFVVAVVAFYN